MSPGPAFAALVWLCAAAAGCQGWRLAGRWRRGRPAPIDWRAGLLALPRRYLHDVHEVVAQKPETARMHVLAAGGLVAGSALAALGILPPLARAGWWWGLVAAAFAVALAGAGLAALRRWPRPPAGLSGGSFRFFPLWLALYAFGGLLASLATFVSAPLPLGLAGVAFGALGGAVLVLSLLDGPFRHALAGVVYLIAHPRPARFGPIPDSALEPIDLAAPLLGVARPIDFAWNRLAGFDACIQCGRCEESCPAFAAGQPLNPKKLIQDFVASLAAGGAPYAGSSHPDAPDLPGPAGPDQPIVGNAVAPETLWSCTTCRACVASCPMMIEHVDAVIALRRFETLEKGAVPEKAAAALDGLRYADDPQSRPTAHRMDAIAGLAVRVLGPGEEADCLLWLGEGAFDLRYGRTLRALVQLLREGSVDVAVLGEAELDCGDLARRLGDEATFQRLARENIATLASRRFRRIVTADPHALHVLRNEYRAFGGNYEVIHHSELLAELLAAGALVPRLRIETPLAYHDPCYLARYQGETAAPRRVLEAIAAKRVEMKRSGLSAMCCGGGGGAPITDVKGRHRIPDLRMKQAAEVGAKVVAVACPGCTAMLEGVTGSRPEVRDIAELLWQAMEPE